MRDAMDFRGIIDFEEQRYSESLGALREINITL